MTLEFLSDGDIPKDSAITTITDPVAGYRSIKTNVKTLIEGDTQSIMNKYKDRFSPSEREKLLRNVNKNKITYHFPWLLYFYPNPKLDANYVLLDPVSDFTKINKIKKNILVFLGLIIIIYFFSILLKSGAIIPSIYTAIFFIGRYITIIALFFLFMFIYKLAKIFPWFARMIGRYSLYTIAPLRNKRFNRNFYVERVSIKELDYILKAIFYAFMTVCFGIITFLLIVLLSLVLSPAIVVVGCIFGLLLGKLSEPLNHFGLGFFEYETNKSIISSSFSISSGFLKTIIFFIVLIIVGISFINMVFNKKEKSKTTNSDVIHKYEYKNKFVSPQPSETAPTTFELITNIIK
jgi:hypothetical protein